MVMLNTHWPAYRRSIPGQGTGLLGAGQGGGTQPIPGAAPLAPGLAGLGPGGRYPDPGYYDGTLANIGGYGGTVLLLRRSVLGQSRSLMKTTRGPQALLVPRQAL